MNALIIVNMMLVLFSGLIMIAGAYGLMGFCCKGNKLSRLFGGVLGLVGLSTFVLTIIPSCY